MVSGRQKDTQLSKEHRENISRARKAQEEAKRRKKREQEEQAREQNRLTFQQLLNGDIARQQEASQEQETQQQQLRDLNNQEQNDEEEKEEDAASDDDNESFVTALTHHDPEPIQAWLDVDDDDDNFDADETYEEDVDSVMTKYLQAIQKRLKVEVSKTKKRALENEWLLNYLKDHDWWIRSHDWSRPTCLLRWWYVLSRPPFCCNCCYL